MAEDEQLGTDLEQEHQIAKFLFLLDWCTGLPESQICHLLHTHW